MINIDNDNFMNNDLSYSLLQDSINENQETELIAQETLNRLIEQREQLINSSNILGDTTSVTRNSRKILNKISFKNFKEKCTLIIVIIFLLIIDSFLAYLLVIHHGHF